MRLSVLLIAATLVGSAPLAAASAAGQKDAAPSGKVVEVTAEALAKECSADSTKATAKYKGKTLRVTGKVGDIYDEVLYLPVQVKAAGEVYVVIRFGKGNKPDVKKGDMATFEGKFDLVAVLGPALVDCKLVTDKKKD